MKANDYRRFMDCKNNFRPDGDHPLRSRSILPGSVFRQF